MTSIRNLALYLVIGILIFLALLVLAAQLTTLRLVSTTDAPLVIEINEWPTPVPTHTPVPTLMPTPTLPPTVSPTDMHFRTAASVGTTLAVGDLSPVVYGTTARRLAFPHCQRPVSNDQEYEYFWILLQPTTTELRTFTLDGFPQLGVFLEPTIPPVAGQTYKAYRTIDKQRCGDGHIAGWGGAHFDITIRGG